MERRMSDYTMCLHANLGLELTSSTIDSKIFFFRFRYQSMERAFIDDLDTVYNSASSVSLGYDGYFVLRHDGSYVHHNLPGKLRRKLCDRVASDPFPSVVSLGTDHPDSYFLQFADGKQHWRRLPGELEDILEDTEYYVDIIALGVKDDYYVKLSNGTEHWYMPDELGHRLQAKHSGRTLAGLSLGHENQYNVRFTGRALYMVDCSYYILLVQTAA